MSLGHLDAVQVESMLVTPAETKDEPRFPASVGDAISQFKTKAAAEQSIIAGIGIGVPGFVFADGMVDSTCEILAFMDDYPLAGLIQRQHGLPCLLNNDARVVALGAAIYG